MEIDNINTAIPVQNTVPPEPPPEEVPISSSEPVPAEQIVPADSNQVVDYLA